jgi:hypothetical protein
MDEKLPLMDDNSGLGKIPSSIPPREALAMFNAELRHYIASMEGCAQVLSMNPPDDLRLHVLGILSRNLARMQNLREVVKIYLDEQPDET